jgi:transketolase
VLRASADHPGAMYIRLGRGRDPVVYDTVPDLTIGKAIRLREGTDLTLIATGSEVRAALDAAAALEKTGTSVRVIDMHTISPLDREEVAAAARETKAIMTVEEHNITGGLGSAVAEVLIDLPRLPFLRHGVPDCYVEVGPPAALYDAYKLDAPGVESVARAFLSRIG